MRPSYFAFVQHGDTGIPPARVSRQLNKAKIEVGMQLMDRRILAVFVKCTYFSLSEFNAEMTGLVGRLNVGTFRTLPGPRRMLFGQLDA